MVAFITIMSLSISILSVPMLRDAYAHGVSTGGNRWVRVEGEQYSDQTIDTDEVLIISGTLESWLLSNEIRLSPYISVSSHAFAPFDINFFPLYGYYPLTADTASWYFRVDSLPNPIVLQPGEEVDYEIRLHPLKAGTYHVHSFFIADDDPIGGAELVGRGATVNVSGSAMPTFGEVTQLYLPFAFGAAAMVFLILRARKTSKELGLGRIRKGIRLYFAAKFSLEAIWLSGLLFWLVFTAYPVIHSFETMFATAAGTTTIIAGLVIGSYFAATTKSRFQNIVAAGTAGASSLFYFLLIPGHLLLTPDSTFTFGLEYGGFGYNRNPFEFNSLVLFAAVIVNGIVAALALISKERHKASKFTDEIISRQ